MIDSIKKAWKTGISFGVTSGIITTLGLIVGLNAGTHSRLAVIGGIITIAIADALSDALGIHISEESKNTHATREIWIATAATLLSKLVIALTFLVPLIFFSLQIAIISSVFWGLSILILLSYILAIKQGIAPWRAVSEHLSIAVIVIITTHLIGDWVSATFG